MALKRKFYMHAELTYDGKLVEEAKEYMRAKINEGKLDFIIQVGTWPVVEVDPWNGKIFARNCFPFMYHHWMHRRANFLVCLYLNHLSKIPCFESYNMLNLMKMIRDFAVVPCLGCTLYKNRNFVKIS